MPAEAFETVFVIRERVTLAIVDSCFERKEEKKA